jgi:hypothetical protein
MERTSRVPRALLLSLALAAAFVAGVCWSRFFRSPLQKLSSRDGTHQAELQRIDQLVDRNYAVYVDGHRVFVSADFVPRSDIPFRETLFWDSTDHSVILEVAGHRIFGYDTTTNRRLSDAELLAAKPPPEPSLWEFSSETEWPGVGRVPVPR